MRSILPPILLLSLLTLFALYHAYTVDRLTEDCLTRLESAAVCANAEDWAGASDILSDTYTRWQGSSSYLHITVNHAMVDAAESMYLRALAFAAAEEPSEFHAELAGLRTQLRLMADTERFHFENIL